MITKESIAKFLSNDSWFRCSKSSSKIEVKNDDGTISYLPRSYYHVFKSNVAKIIIRISDHGTYLNTWVKSYTNPTNSLQNLSVVFSNGPIEFDRKIEKLPNGKQVYFVVEQYVYRLDNLSINDFKRVVNEIKSLDNNNVFSDPLKKNPKKRAGRSVLTPTDINTGKDIPPSTNTVHPRQTAVANNRYKEIDKDGNVIEISQEDLKKIITESTFRVVKELYKQW